MARGWESKSVESQMEAIEERRNVAKAPRLTPEQAARYHERDSLLLQRDRVLHDIAAARHPNHRKTLESALGFLNEKLNQLQPLSDREA